MKNKKYFIILIFIFLIILTYNKLPYNSFSLSKVGVDELNGSIRINFLKEGI